MVPTDTRLPKYTLPVVVAPPITVSPVEDAPPPIVDDAFERKPARSGLLLNTARPPVPVSSESASLRNADVPVVVKRLFASVKSARDAVSAVTLRLVVVAVPLMVSPVAPVPPPMVDEALITIPFVEEGVSASPAVLRSQFDTPSASAESTPFVTERLLPVISVITSAPILNVVAARLVVVAFVMVAFVPRSEVIVAPLFTTRSATVAVPVAVKLPPSQKSPP